MHFSKVPALIFAAATALAQWENFPVALLHAGQNCTTREWVPVENNTCTSVKGYTYG
ncbi:hypothetical protein JDV02_009084 [Purpureocillium takamizusanense]|uniref:Uncharacterized protein n=1 Tax=Purpureocillium takamizusanense TaxID=2060973 RepID=A0A9Q8VFX1_9HYPO|nr:uncharacterized protein JDV02_009084 [Purpureocillium takamizusanense]UNI23252.1 hypothetical protein JDV02_009084 [Purpureocillium takamizusanense]